VKEKDAFLHIYWDLFKSYNTNIDV